MSMPRRLLPAFCWRQAVVRAPLVLAFALALIAMLVASISTAGAAHAAPGRQTTSAHTMPMLPVLHWHGGNGPPPVLTAAVSGGPDTLDVFAMTANPFVPAQIFGSGWNGSTWSVWESIGEADAGTSPAFVTYGQNSLAFFSEYQGNLQEVSGAGSFPSWNSSTTVLSLPFATAITSGPGATSWGGTRLDVFVWTITRFGRFSWSGLLHEWSTNGGATWQSETLPTFAGFSAAIAPVVVSRGANDLTVLAFATNDSLSALTWNGSAWGNWQSLGGYLPAQRIAAQPLAGNQVHVLGVGGNGAVYDNTLTGSSWSGWNSLGGYVESSPTVSSWAYDSMTVCALGGDNAVWCRDDIYGSWSNWYSLGGSFADGFGCTTNCSNYYWIPDSPVSAVSDLGTLDVFAQTSDLNVWHTEGSWDFYSGWGWSGWDSVGVP